MPTSQHHEDAVGVAPGGEDTDLNRRNTIILLVMCAAVFLDSLDTSLVGVALPSIKSDLHLSDSTLQWLISGYTVAYGGFLLLGGRTADLLGRRKVFMAAMIIFSAASIFGGFATGGSLLIASRLIKGLAAAFTAPAALSIITTTFHEGSARNRALAFYTATAASGYSLGLVLSGLLTQINWRLIFFLPAVVGAIVLVVTPMAVTADAPRTGPRRSYDPAGALTITSAVLLLVYGLVEAPTRGWTSVSTLGVLALAIVLAVCFVAIERRQSDPSVPLTMFRIRSLTGANVLAVTFASATIGWQFIATLYLQQLLHYSALKTALALLPLGVTIFCVAQFVTARLIPRVGMRAIASTGSLIQGCGILLFAFGGVSGHYVTIMLPGLLLHGFGNGLVFPTMNIGGVNGVEDEQQGIASGMITASFQIGCGIGLAILTGVLTASSDGSGASGQWHGYRTAFMVASLFSLLGIAVAWLGLPGRVAPSTEEAAPPTDEAPGTPAAADEPVADRQDAPSHP